MQPTVSVGTDRSIVSFELAPPHPNPFRSGLTLDLALPVSAPVRLEIFDLQGRQVRSLVDGTLTAGRHQRSWDGTSASGSPARTGVYLVRFTAPAFQVTRKAILVR